MFTNKHLQLLRVKSNRCPGCCKGIKVLHVKEWNQKQGKKLRIYNNRNGEVFWLKKCNCLEYKERVPIGVVKEGTERME